MTEETRTASSWLPNLVGGVSIWKLARDLNEPKFFDGALLVPETEGTDSLPTSVRWDVSGLLPLKEAKAKHAADVDAAVRDFLERLRGVGDEMATETSGYHKYKDAFTVPGLDADDGAYYFFDERAKRLRLINWGASPRSLGGEQKIVFGWAAFGQLIETAAPPPAPAVSAAAEPAAVAPPAAVAADGKGKDAKSDKDGAKQENDAEKEKNKRPAGGRPLWQWLLVAIVLLLLLALLVFLFRDCEGTDVAYPEAGAHASSGLDGQVRANAGSDAGDAMARPDAPSERGGSDAGSDGAAVDGAKNVGQDARADGHADEGGGGGPPGAGSGGPGGTGGGPGKGVGVGSILVTPGGADLGLPRVEHFEPRAVRWRVAGGREQLDPTSPISGDGQRFQVLLKASGSFDKVKVQWQDQAGTWHE